MNTRRLWSGILLAALSAAAAAPARAWQDANLDRIDDSIESVHANGWNFAFENQDPGGRMLIGVSNPLAIQYSVYVGYDHHPLALDATTLLTTGVTMAWPFENIDYVESRATWTQIQSILGLPGVTRIEAVPVMYASNHYGARTVRARDSRGVSGADNWRLFPSAEDLGIDGTGIVIAILDTGVNDDVDQVNAGYPGHESVHGKFLGGGEFWTGQEALNTGLDESSNPQDHGAEASSYHATHVAGSAMGTGGIDAYFRGVAPGARLVDCKVLSDAGASVGGSERGLDWVIHNRNTLWDGLTPGSIWQGIDVVNMSLGSPTSNDDGTSATAQLVNTAVDNGIVVCIASGNDSRGTGASGSTTEAGMASPASADKCIAVGASSTSHSLDRTDDRVTDFSNEGPRMSDGDADLSDELKPDVVAPGAGIISADGDPTGDGTGYKQLSGTSMACPHAAGCVALLLQANPALTPLQVRTILHNTAEHMIPSVKGPFRTYALSTDVNYDPGSGWGLIDIYAAIKEAQNSTSGVQVVLFRSIADPGNQKIDVTWITQREHPFLGFNVFRAPDVAGAPGTFAQINGPLVAPSTEGDPVIQNDDNRTPYVYQDTDAALELGRTYWYRIDWVDATGTPHSELPAPVVYGDAPRVATVYYSLAHNTPDNDLQVRIGTDGQYMPGTLGDADFEVLGLAENQQDSSAVLLSTVPANTGTSTLGTVEHFWSVGFTVADGIGGYLPPSVAHPWFLNVIDGGYVNRTGRMTSFSMFVNTSPGSPSGTLYVTDHVPMPQPFVEGGVLPVTAWIPEEQPVPVEFARFEATGGADGVRLVLDLTGDSDPAAVRIWRGLSDELDGRVALGGAQAMTDRHFEYTDITGDPGVDYRYWIEVIDRTGVAHLAGPVVGRLSDRGRITHAEPARPNPTKAGTVFRYTIGTEASGSTVPVTLRIHDLQGRVVRELKTGTETSGDHEVTWDGRDGNGSPVPSGVYYYRFTAGSRTTTSKVTIVR